MSELLDSLNKLDKKQRQQRTQAKTLDSYYSQRSSKDSHGLFLLSVCAGVFFAIGLSYLMQSTLLSTIGRNLSFTSLSQRTYAAYSQLPQASAFIPSFNFSQQDRTHKIGIVQSVSGQVDGSEISTASNTETRLKQNIFTSNAQLIENIQRLGLFKKQGKRQEFVQLLATLKEANPNNSTIMRISAEHALDSHKDKQYVSEMKELISHHNQSQDILELSRYLMKNKRYKDLARTLELLPPEQLSQQQPQEMLGYAFIQTQQWDKANEVYSFLTKKWPYEPSYWLGRGKSLEESEIFDKALSSYHQALNLQPQLSIKKLAVAGVIRLKSYEYGQLQQGTLG